MVEDHLLVLDIDLVDIDIDKAVVDDVEEHCMVVRVVELRRNFYFKNCKLNNNFLFILPYACP